MNESQDTASYFWLESNCGWEVDKTKYFDVEAVVFLTKKLISLNVLPKSKDNDKEFISVDFGFHQTNAFRHVKNKQKDIH